MGNHNSFRKYNANNTVLYLVSLLSLFELFADCFTSSSFLTCIYIVQVFFVFFISFIFTLKRIGFLHIFSLLQITTFIFSLGGIFVFILLGSNDFKVSYTPTYVRFHEVTVQKAICLYSLFIGVSYISFFYFYRKIKFNPVINLIPNTDFFYFKLGKATMLSMFPFALLSSYTQFQIGFENRGMLYISGSMADLGIPLYLRITNMLFTTGFFIIIASVPKQKDFLKYFALYSVSLIPILMMGERGEVITPIIFLLWYLNRIYNTKVNLGLLFGSGIGVMLVSFVVSVVRLGDSVEGLSITDMITGFFATSATSLDLLQYYVEFKSTIPAHNYPFVFDSLIGGLTGAYGQSLETLQVRSCLGHQLVYALNPDYYLHGFSTGTSYIAECYEFGTLGVAIGGIVLGWFCNVFNTYITKNHFRMLFLYLFFQMIILSPRGSLFVGIYDIIKYTFCFFVLKHTIGLFYKNK